MKSWSGEINPFVEVEEQKKTEKSQNDSNKQIHRENVYYPVPQIAAKIKEVVAASNSEKPPINSKMDVLEIGRILDMPKISKAQFKKGWMAYENEMGVRRPASSDAEARKAKKIKMNNNKLLKKGK